MKVFMKDSYRRRILWIMFWIVCAFIVKAGMKYVDEEKTSEVFAQQKTMAEPVLPGKEYQSFSFERTCEYTCQYTADDSMYIGEMRVIAEGEKGVQRTTILKTFYNGKQIDEKVIDNEIIKASVARVVAVGTKERPEYITPVEDYVFTSPFGQRWGRMHQGVDLAVVERTSVMAAADGEVILSQWNGGYGNCIYVEHNSGAVTVYAHLSENLVQVGDLVTQGQVIALSGNTGNSTGPHLHFEIRINDEAVNPLEYIDVKK